MAGPWLYIIREGKGRTFDIEGESIPVTVDSFRDLVKDERLGEDRFWYISQNWRHVEVGDQLFIYTGDANLGIIGYATISNVEQQNGRWCIHPHFNFDRCRMLLEKPIRPSIVQGWARVLRMSVVDLSKFASELDSHLPWAASRMAVSPIDLNAISAELNARARTHPIGKLQEIRTELKRLARRPGQNIFSDQTIHQDWAFHHGGRSELQFNIGKDGSDSLLRHGVAFSFETSQTLPTIDSLANRVPLFNEFMRLYPDLYAHMRIWHWRNGQRSSPPDNMPGPIAPELVEEGVFVFLGKLRPLDELDYEVILDDFDRLLPLYLYVESGGELPPVSLPTIAAFSFRPGCSIKARYAIASRAQKDLDVNLRHNLLQEALYQRLESQFGVDNVGTELPSGVGTSVDVVVRRSDDFWFYEIKTAHSPRACIREALAQLLEYAFWPGAQEASRLIIVGEPALDKDGEQYLRLLRRRFSLPIFYEQIIV